MNYRARCSPKGQHLVQAEKQLVSASTKDGYREEDEKSRESGGLGRKTLSYRAQVFIGGPCTVDSYILGVRGPPSWPAPTVVAMPWTATCAAVIRPHERCTRLHVRSEMPRMSAKKLKCEARNRGAALARASRPARVAARSVELWPNQRLQMLPPRYIAWARTQPTVHGPASACRRNTKRSSRQTRAYKSSVRRPARKCGITQVTANESTRTPPRQMA